MGSMGVVINVIVSFHSIYIYIYHISHIYIYDMCMICVSYTHIYRYISRFSTFFLSLVAMGSHSLLLRMALPC